MKLSEENKNLAIEKISKNYKEILSVLRESYSLDDSNENFTETPYRIAKMMITENFIGINSEEECKELLSKTFPTNSSTSDQLIITTNPLITYSTCPHHFSTVTYKVWSGYIPSDRVVGLSKISRVIDLYAKQPILQEEYVSNLADIIMTSDLNPKGVIIICKAVHGCMTTRGAKVNPSSSVVNSALRGLFGESGQHTWKEEFISLCDM